MNKLVVSMLAVAAVLSACSKDDDEKGGGKVEKLVTPELASVYVGESTPFTGGLSVLPCLKGTSTYYGNFNKTDELNTRNPFYGISKGEVVSLLIPVKLPLGTYNFVYWGVTKNASSDSIFGASAIQDPPLRIGTNLAQSDYRLRKYNNPDTTYYPVFDYVFARQDIVVGTDKMEATLARAVAGLKVTLINQNGTKINPGIASARILVGSIAYQMNYYTATPSDFTKTIAFPIAVSADSLQMSANSTVMLFPSGNAPLLTILLTLKNGQVKKYQKPLAAPFTAGNRLTLTITMGEIFSGGTSSEGFEVKDWKETTETINFLPG